MNNSKHLGAATVFVYPSKDRYIGVCLELDLVDEDSDKDVLAERMQKRIESYVDYIQTKNFDDSLLNRPAPKKYWNKFYAFLALMKEEEKSHARSASNRRRKAGTSPTRNFVVSRQNLERVVA